MAFLRERIDEEVSQGATFTLEDNVVEVPTRSGFVQRIALWSAPRRIYSISYETREKQFADAIRNLYMRAGGKLEGFLLKDWNDFEATDENLDPIPIDGNPNFAVQWQLVKRYGNRKRVIRFPVDGTFSFSPQSPFRSVREIDYDTGIVTLGTQRNINEELPVNFEFDVPVRFSDDSLDVVIGNIENASIPSIELQELIGEFAT